jgi:hypothetical protein
MLQLYCVQYCFCFNLGINKYKGVGVVAIYNKPKDLIIKDGTDYYSSMAYTKSV